MADIKENVIEWITGDEFVSCTFTQRKYITKVRKLMDKQPLLVPKFVQNSDGSIYCRLPLKALKLYIKTSDERTLESDEEDEFMD